MRHNPVQDLRRTLRRSKFGRRRQFCRAARLPQSRPLTGCCRSGPALKRIDAQATITDTGPFGSSARRESGTRCARLSRLCDRPIGLQTGGPDTYARKGTSTRRMPLLRNKPRLKPSQPVQLVDTKKFDMFRASAMPPSATLHRTGFAWKEMFMAPFSSAQETWFCRNSAMRSSIAARPRPIKKPASRTGSQQTRLGL